MNIKSINAVEFNSLNFNSIDSHNNKEVSNDNEQEPVINLNDEINDSVEEVADLLSSFGRSGRNGRKKDNGVDDFTSSILEDGIDEKMEVLVKRVTQFQDKNQLLSFMRGLFPHDSDLMLALRELLLNRQLSQLQKKKIKEAIADLDKFGDSQKMKSGMNVGRVAKRFSEGAEPGKLSAQVLRESYLRFLEMDVPAGYLYMDWINSYGCSKRIRLLAFTLSALVADMKANEPGIHFQEFGPLSNKLIDARTLHSLDEILNERFAGLPFVDLMRDNEIIVDEEDIVKLYMTGLTDYYKFEPALEIFTKKFMSLLMVKQKARVIQLLMNVFSLTPAELYIDSAYREIILKYISHLMKVLYEKETAIEYQKILEEDGYWFSKLNNKV